jgi:uncharacterized Zn-binding protein involved in type VI secretion
MTKSRMMGLCEQECDSTLAEDAGLTIGWNVERDPHGFEYISAAASTRCRAVPVLRHGNAASCHDHRSRTRQIQCLRTVATRSARVDHDGQAMVDAGHRGSHRLYRGGDGFYRLPRHPEGNRKGSHLHRRPFTRKDRLEGRADLVWSQRSLGD